MKVLTDTMDWVDPTYSKLAIWWIFSGVLEVAFNLLVGTGKTDGGTLFAATVPGLLGIVLGVWMYFKLPIFRLIAPYLTGIKIFFSLLGFFGTLALAISGPKVGIPAVLVYILNIVAGGLTLYLLNTWGDYLLGEEIAPD